MPDRMALKRLTGSDLTFFDYHYQNRTFGESKQKAINLNIDVFLDELYPALRGMGGARINVLTTIYGPGALGAFMPAPATRPILNNNGKNWRLNGATIPDDPAHLERFRDLNAGDLALFRFRGDPVPTETDVLLISAAADPAAHAALDGLVGEGRRSMSVVTHPLINGALAGVALAANHPLLDLEVDAEIDAEVEDVALGGPIGPALRRRRGGSRLTPEELARARAEAGRIGAAGEAALNGWLDTEQGAGRISDVVWVARGDAAAPFDFTHRETGDLVRTDAKSTSGPFERPIHVSIAEVIEAARLDAPGPYRIARIYEMDDDGAKCRILPDFRDAAREILDGAAGLPAWSEPDGFRIRPDALHFDVDEIILTWPDPGEDDAD